MAPEQAVREMREMIAKFPGFEPESVKCQPFMVPFATLTEWADALETALAEKDARIAELERECEDLMRIPDRCDQVALRGEE